jgi:hypothetical protein
MAKAYLDVALVCPADGGWTTGQMEAAVIPRFTLRGRAQHGAAAGEQYALVALETWVDARHGETPADAVARLATEVRGRAEQAGLPVLEVDAGAESPGSGPRVLLDMRPGVPESSSDGRGMEHGPVTVRSFGARQELAGEPARSSDAVRPVRSFGAPPQPLADVGERPVRTWGAERLAGGRSWVVPSGQEGVVAPATVAEALRAQRDVRAARSSAASAASPRLQRRICPPRTGTAH